MYKEIHGEMRLQLQRHASMANSLGTKSNQLMIAAGIVATVIAGFTGIEIGQRLSTDSGIIITIVLGLLICTVVLCILINRIEFSMNPILGRKMMSGDIFNEEVIERWTGLGEDEYYREMIETYARCLKNGEDVIKSKARWLTGSIILFMTGMILVPVPIILHIIPHVF